MVEVPHRPVPNPEGRQAALTAVDQAPPADSGFPNGPLWSLWLPASWFLALLLLLYAPVLKGMVKDWWSVESMHHGFLVPFVSAFMVWHKRKTLRSLRVVPRWWGLVWIGWAYLQLLMGTASADFFLARTAFLIALLGVLWSVWGSAVVRTIAFPIFLLCFMIRVPQFIYSPVTLNLQALAGRLAAATLNLFHVPVVRDGIFFELAHHQQLAVHEACTGVRLLYSVLFVISAYAYLFGRNRWRWIVLAAVIPVMVAANAAVTTLMIMVNDWKPALALEHNQGFEALATSAAALGILIAMHRSVRRLNFLVRTQD